MSTKLHKTIVIISVIAVVVAIILVWFFLVVPKKEQKKEQKAVAEVLESLKGIPENPLYQEKVNGFLDSIRNAKENDDSVEKIPSETIQSVLDSLHR